MRLFAFTRAEWLDVIEIKRLEEDLYEVCSKHFKSKPGCHHQYKLIDLKEIISYNNAIILLF